MSVAPRCFDYYLVLYAKKPLQRIYFPPFRSCHGAHFFFILTETVYLNTGVCKYFYHPSRRKDLSPFTCLRVPAAGGSRGLTRMPWVGRELLSAGGI